MCDRDTPLHLRINRIRLEFKDDNPSILHCKNILVLIESDWNLKRVLIHISFQLMYLY